MNRFVYGLVQFETAMETFPKLLGRDRLRGVAGLSGGVITALTAAKVVSYEDGLRWLLAIGQGAQNARPGSSLRLVTGIDEPSMLEIMKQVNASPLEEIKEDETKAAVTSGSIDDEFKAAADSIKQLTVAPSQDKMLLTYALFKQATVGNVNISQPGMLKVEARAKWGAWNKQKGTSSDDAKRAYIKLVKELHAVTSGSSNKKKNAAQLGAAAAAAVAAGGAKRRLLHIAIRLGSQAFTVGGDEQSLAMMTKRIAIASNNKGQVRTLPYAPAYHTPWMDTEAPVAHAILYDMKFSPPQVPVLVGDIDGRVLTDIKQIKDLVWKQFEDTVHWTPVMATLTKPVTMSSYGYSSIIEVGPGRGLTILARADYKTPPPPLTFQHLDDIGATPAEELKATPELEALQSSLITVWSDVLETKVKLTDDFFDFEGGSIRAMILISKLRAMANASLQPAAAAAAAAAATAGSDNGPRVTPRIAAILLASQPMDLFTYTTVQKLAAYLYTKANGTSGGGEASVWTSAVVSDPTATTGVASTAQARIYLDEQVRFSSKSEGSAAVYNIPLVMQPKGRVNLDKFGATLGAVVARNAALRTTLRIQSGESKGTTDTAGQLTQYVLPWPAGQSLPVDVVMVPLSSDQKSLVDAEVVKLMNERFDLSKDVLIRATVVRRATTFQRDGVDDTVVLVAHHSAFDGWSIRLLINELSLLWKGQVSSLPSLPLTYIDYARLESKALQSSECTRSREWWTNHLHDAVGLSLPHDIARPGGHRSQDVTAGVVSVVLPPDITAVFGTLRQQTKSTPFMVVLSLLSVLLQQQSGSTDFTIGSVSAGRFRSELEPMIGMFVNTLLYRSRVDPTKSFMELLTSMREQCVEVMAHSTVPFDTIVNDLRAKQPDIDANALLNVVILEGDVETANSSFDMDGTRIEMDKRYAEAVQQRAHAQFDLTFSITPILGATPAETSIRCEFFYATDIFARGTIERMAERWLHLCRLLATNASSFTRPLSELGTSLSVEERKILDDVNNTAADFGTPLRIEGAIAECCTRHPDKAAIWFEGKEMTYSQLMTRATNVAAILRSHGGVQPGNVVAHCIDRSFDMIVGMVAIVMAGGVYCALNPAYPRDRLLAALNGCKAVCVLTTHPLADKFKFPSDKHVFIDDDLPECKSLPPVGTPADLAYIITTSGSTGEPKFVPLPHRNLFNCIRGLERATMQLPSDRVLQISGVSFDVHITETFGSLIMGATIVMPPIGAPLDLAALLACMRDARVTQTFAVPTLLAAIALFGEHDVVRAAFGNVRALGSGGEAVRPDHITQFRPFLPPTCDIWNWYAPAECTVVGIARRFDTTDQRAPMVALGGPLSNVRVYVLTNDVNMDECPIGTIGQLYMAGAGVFDGYLHRPDLTAMAIVNHPKLGRLYRSGDLARWRHDGQIMFLGRADFQIKLRGQRLEPGEIEAVLVRNPAIKLAIVLKALLKMTAAGTISATANEALVAYVSANNDKNGISADQWSAVDRSKLRDELHGSCRNGLPPFMVPSAIVIMSQMPLNPNGKVDRKKLPPPVAVDMCGMGAAVSGPVVAPRNAVEKALRPLWAEVLAVGIDTVSVEADFFASGGNSLKGMLLLSRVRAALVTWSQGGEGIAPELVTIGKVAEVRVVDLFSNASVAGLTTYLQAQVKTSDSLSPNDSSLSSVPPASQREALTGPWSSNAYTRGVASSAQARIFLDEQMRFTDADRTAAAIYHIPMFLRPTLMKGTGIAGERPFIDAERLSYCLSTIVGRHAALRTTLTLRTPKDPSPTTLAPPSAFKQMTTRMSTKIVAARASGVERKSGTIDIGDHNLATFSNGSMTQLWQKVQPWSSAHRLNVEVIKVIVPASLANSSDKIVLENLLEPSIRRFVETPFDLATDLLLRAAIVRCQIEGKQHDDDEKVNGDGHPTHDGEWDEAMVIVGHHSAFDGWSVGLLFNELQQLWSHAPTAGTSKASSPHRPVLSNASRLPQALPTLPITYIDFARYEAEAMATKGGMLANSRRWWTANLTANGTIDAAALSLQLPVDHLRNGTRSGRAAKVEILVPVGVRSILAQMERQTSSTPFMMLMSILATLLHQSTSATDFCIGSVTAGRFRSELEPMIGMFVNTLLYRCHVDRGQTFAAVHQSIRQQCLAVLEHSLVPFDLLIQDLRKKDESLDPGALLRCLLLYGDQAATNGANHKVDLVTTDMTGSEHGLSLVPLDMPKLNDLTTRAKFDLALSVAEHTSGGWSCSFEYDVDLFEPSTVKLLADRWLHLCTQLSKVIGTDAASRPLGELDALSDNEKAILASVNKTDVDFGVSMRVEEAIAQRAQANPSKLAVVWDGGELSYGDLITKATALANHLQTKHGVTKGSVVAQCLDRCVDVVIGMVGILMAGATYCPFNTKHPRDRLITIGRNAGASVVITNSMNASLFEGSAMSVVVVDRPFPPAAEENVLSLKANESKRVGPPLAYIIATSGSTGEPKVVPIAHHQLLGLCFGMRHIGAINDTDRSLLTFACSFDPHVMDVYNTLVAGATLVLPPEQIELDPIALIRFIHKYQCTTWGTVPSLLNACLPALESASPTHETKRTVNFFDEPRPSLPASPSGSSGPLPSNPLSSLRWIQLGGEELRRQLVVHAQSLIGSHVIIVNAYGPTECTVATTAYLCTADAMRTGGLSMPIGRPIPGYQCHILDDRFQPVAIGALGQLYIGGQGVFEGYVGRPDLTAAAICEHPTLGRLYRSGDLAKWRNDAQIVFGGRADFQVKLRGQRLEPAEIEAVIAKYPDVTDVLVVKVTKPSEMLIAYVAIKGIDHATVEVTSATRREIESICRSTLPSFMVPSGFVLLPALPVNANGKVDRKQLPPPTPADMGHGDEPVVMTQPTNPLQVVLRRLVASVANVPEETVSLSARLDSMGWSSLASMRLLSLLRSQVSPHASIAMIMRAPTLALLADALATLPSVAIATPKSARMGKRKSMMFSGTPRAGAAGNGDVAISVVVTPGTNGASTNGDQKTSNGVHGSSPHKLWTPSCGLVMSQILAVVLLVLFQSVALVIPVTVLWQFQGGIFIGRSMPQIVQFMMLNVPVSMACGLGAQLVLFWLFKWIVLGRVTAGSYPLWGSYHFRWWMVRGMWSYTAPMLRILDGTIVVPIYLWCLGVKLNIWSSLVLSFEGIQSFDLIDIGAHTFVGRLARFHCESMAGHRFTLGNVRVGERCVVEESAVLNADTDIGNDCTIRALSSVSKKVPNNSIWEAHALSVDGSTIAAPLPYKYAEHQPLTWLAFAIIKLFILVIIILMMAAPYASMLVFIYFANPKDWSVVQRSAILALFGFAGSWAQTIVGVILTRVFCCGIHEGRYVVGSYTWQVQWWVRDRLMSQLVGRGLLMSEFHFTPVILSLLGATIGSNVDVRPRNLNTFAVPLPLLTLGNMCTTTGEALLGPVRIERGEWIVAAIKLGDGVFVGNGAIVEPGTSLRAGVLVGSMSVARPQHSSSFPRSLLLGVPAVVFGGDAASRGSLAEPRRPNFVMRYLARPTLALIFAAMNWGALFPLVWLNVYYIQKRELGPLLLMVVIYKFAPIVLGPLLWLPLSILFGLRRLKPTSLELDTLKELGHEIPFGIMEVWLNRMAPLMRGSQLYISMLRFMGATIGNGCVIDGLVGEPALTTIGDDVVLEDNASVQCHIIENGFLKLNKIHVNDEVYLQSNTLVFPGVTIALGCSTLPATLLLANDSLPPNTCWAGNPAGFVSEHVGHLGDQSDDMATTNGKGKDGGRKESPMAMLHARASALMPFPVTATGSAPTTPVAEGKLHIVLQRPASALRGHANGQPASPISGRAHSSFHGVFPVVAPTSLPPPPDALIQFPRTISESVDLRATQWQQHPNERKQ
jgi:non-ribosomal peptide synthetase-like protein